MPPAIQKNAKSFFITSPQLDGVLTHNHFEPTYLSSFESTTTVENGRATVWFFNITPSISAVLRHYYRGGQIAKVSADKFVWHGISRTRAVREYRLLEHMHNLDLPVPEPLGARITRHGVLYSCDLITRQIPDTQTLATILTTKQLNSEEWNKVGRTIKKLHQHHIWHSDLNANNILINKNGDVSLIDFDRCRIRAATNFPWIHGRWEQRNLERLRRSLRKGVHQSSINHYKESDWQLLIDGYKG